MESGDDGGGNWVFKTCTRREDAVNDDGDVNQNTNLLCSVVSSVEGAVAEY